jgi:hypothetical protein
MDDSDGTPANKHSSTKIQDTLTNTECVSHMNIQVSNNSQSSLELVVFCYPKFKQSYYVSRLSTLIEDTSYRISEVCDDNRVVIKRCDSHKHTPEDQPSSVQSQQSQPQQLPAEGGPTPPTQLADDIDSLPEGFSDPSVEYLDLITPHPGETSDINMVEIGDIEMVDSDKCASGEIAKQIERRYRSLWWLVAQSEKASSVSELQNSELGLLYDKASAADIPHSHEIASAMIKLPTEAGESPYVESVQYLKADAQTDFDLPGEYMSINIPVSETLSVEDFKTQLQIALRQHQHDILSLASRLQSLVVQR